MNKIPQCVLGSPIRGGEGLGCVGHSGVLAWLPQAPGEDSGPGSMLQSQPTTVLQPNFNPGTIAETKQVGHCVTL